MRRLRISPRRLIKRFFRVNILKLLLLLIVFVIPLLILYLPNLIVIDEIKCFNQYDKCSPQVNDRINMVNTNKYGMAKRYVEKVLQQDMLVKDYSLHFQFPSTIVINIIERKPKFALSSTDVSGSVTIDEDGYALSIVDTTSLPTLNASGVLPNPGDKVDEETLFGLRIIYNISSIYKINNAELKKDQLNIKLDDGKTIVFPLTGDMQYLIGAMNMVLLRLNNVSTDTKIVNVNYIDLRYKNPVLKQI